MKIDYEYLEKILEVFLESKLPTVDWDSFQKIHKLDENKFVFHIEIMVDKRLMIGTSQGGSIGIRRDSLGEYVVSTVPWRLTADGHDFAKALTRPGILSVIQNKFKQEGPSAVIDIAKKIATKQALKLLEDDESL